MPIDIDRLKDRTSKLGEDELIKIAFTNSHEYQPVAISIAREEINKRGYVINEREDHIEITRPDKSTITLPKSPSADHQADTPQVDIKCPKCGRINHASAPRCDCGYGLSGIPVWVPTMLAILGAMAFFIEYGRSATEEGGRFTELMARILFVCALIAVTYWQLTKRKRWAYVLLIILTFPPGLLFLFSKRLKAYLRQKDVV